MKAISMKICNNTGVDNYHQRIFPPASHPEKTLGSTAKYLLFLSLYIGQYAPVGFTWLTMPVILRSHGFSLGAIGMMALLYSPWALKFLYSSILERFPLPIAGRRKGWIMITRVMALVTLFLLAGNSPEQGLLLPICLILAMNFFFAVSDLAVDGYATDILLPKERSWGACLQITGNFAGFMVGGGVFLILYHHLGWEITLWLMACFILLLTMPMAFHKELTRNYWQTKKADKDPSQKPHPLSFVARPQTKALFVLLVIAAIVFKSGYQVRLSLLADLGMNPGQIGSLTLWAGSPLSMVGTILTGVFLKRTAMNKLFQTACALAGLLGFLSWGVAGSIFSSKWVLAAMIGLEQILMGGIMAAIYTLILRASVGPQSGTDYGILCGVQHLTSFCAVIAAGYLSQALGYGPFYIFLALGSLVFIFPVKRLFLDSLRSLNQPDSEPGSVTKPFSS